MRRTTACRLSAFWIGPIWAPPTRSTLFVMAAQLPPVRVEAMHGLLRFDFGGDRDAAEFLGLAADELAQLREVHRPRDDPLRLELRRHRFVLQRRGDDIMQAL